MDSTDLFTTGVDAPRFTTRCLLNHDERRRVQTIHRSDERSTPRKAAAPPAPLTTLLTS